MRFSILAGQTARNLTWLDAAIAGVFFARLPKSFTKSFGTRSHLACK
jgi:hypothetical protein